MLVFVFHFILMGKSVPFFMHVTSPHPLPHLFCSIPSHPLSHPFSSLSLSLSFLSLSLSLCLSIFLSLSPSLFPSHPPILPCSMPYSVSHAGWCRRTRTPRFSRLNLANESRCVSGACSEHCCLASATFPFCPALTQQHTHTHTPSHLAITVYFQTMHNVSIMSGFTQR